MVPDVVASVGASGVERDKLKPVGTFVVVVRLCKADTRTPDCVGVISKLTKLLSAPNDRIGLPTRPRPATASMPCG